jgi:hypothetical protein
VASSPDVDTWSSGGSLIKMLSVSVLLRESVTVTVYVPAVIPTRSSTVAPFDQIILKGATPPEMVRSIPVVCPAHGMLKPLKDVDESETDKPPDSGFFAAAASIPETTRRAIHNIFKPFPGKRSS